MHVTSPDGRDLGEITSASLLAYYGRNGYTVSKVAATPADTASPVEADRVPEADPAVEVEPATHPHKRAARKHTE